MVEDQKVDVRKNFMKRKCMDMYTSKLLLNSFLRGPHEEARGICDELKEKEDTRSDQCKEAKAYAVWSRQRTGDQGFRLKGHPIQWVPLV